jgi:hypothetical protein
VLFVTVAETEFWSCNCDSCWRRSVKSLTKWSSSDSELLWVCQHLECSMFDGGWTLFAQLLQSAFPFYCWNSNNLRLVFLCMTLPIFVFVMLGVGKRKVKIPWDVSVVSPLFQPDLSFLVWKRSKSLRIRFAKWLLIVHNSFNCCRYWLHITTGNCCLPSCWSAGSGF